MAAREQPHRAAQQVIAFKYGETAQQALASIAAAINEYAHGDSGAVAVEAISHTVTQLAEPIPPVPGIGDPGPGYFVVTALVTFRSIGMQTEGDGGLPR
ncbi:MAG: hypothetical protein M3Y58_11060 [Chloroflexota bacterium]|nr:hypothetical protein [Chloroflexota bacterium]